MRNVNISEAVSVGDGKPCFVIAEIGANHNRSLAAAKELIDAAAEARADAVKLQIYTAESLYSKRTPHHSNYNKDLFSLIKEIETPREWLPELADYCGSKKILFFATPFDKAAVDELDCVSSFFKVASFEIVDLPLIKYIASKGKPIIISTGLCTMGEIEDALAACYEVSNRDVILLQCASAYPAPASVMNLRAMETMRRAFAVPVGLSDHSPGIHISVSAAALGACAVEKHVTLSRKSEGPDHPFAIEPNELCELVRQIREVESAMGSGLKSGPSDAEREFYDIARRSLHAAANIPKGKVITEEMICSKRPGYGIRPKFMQQVIGRSALRDIAKDEWITWSDL